MTTVDTTDIGAREASPPPYPSTELDKYMLRLPDGMRMRLKSEAQRNNRSLNAEIVYRLGLTVAPLNEPLPRQRGNARPVEPGTRYASLSWSDLDDMLNTVRQASDLVEAIHMAAEHPDVTSTATGAMQEVCNCVSSRLGGVMKTVEFHMHAAVAK